jgi:hypothetical protein
LYFVRRDKKVVSVFVRFFVRRFIGSSSPVSGCRIQKQVRRFVALQEGGRELSVSSSKELHDVMSLAILRQSKVWSDT